MDCHAELEVEYKAGPVEIRRRVTFSGPEGAAIALVEQWGMKVAEEFECEPEPLGPEAGVEPPPVPE